jgi:hypothetical protein
MKKLKKEKKKYTGTYHLLMRFTLCFKLIRIRAA